ncbi:hypothetical protein [Microvirga sp. TS319]|uniref:hypothetical protein n=1 Tax=Microvirga sp. TS319 TaxID=3241165 RepID=UPI00351A0FDD
MLIQFAQNDDPLRVMSNNAYVADDLDPRVIYSSKYRGGVCEYFTTTRSFGTTEISGTFALAGSYSVRPLVLGVAIIGGAPLYPSGWCNARMTNPNSASSWVGEAEYFIVRSTLSAVEYKLRQPASGSAIIRIWAMG